MRSITTTLFRAAKYADTGKPLAAIVDPVRETIQRGFPVHIVTTSWIAQQLKVSRRTVLLWIQAGRLKSTRLGHAHFVKMSEFDRFASTYRKWGRNK